MNDTDRAEAASVGRLYREMWRHGGPKRPVFVAACFLLFVAELIKLSIPWLAGRGMDVLQSQGLSGVRDAGGWLGAMIAMIVLSWSTYGPGRILERNFALEVRMRHMNHLLHRLMNAPLSWHEARHTGDISDRLAKSNSALFSFSQEQYIYIKCVVMLVGPAAALFVISKWVGGLALFGYFSIVWLSATMDKSLIQFAHEENQAERKLSSMIFDTLSNVFTIFALRRRQGMQAMVVADLLKVFEPLRKVIVWNEVKWATVDILANLLWCGLIALYIWEMTLSRESAPSLSHGVNLGGLFMVYQYSRQMDSVINDVAFQFSGVARHRANLVSQDVIEEARYEPSDLPLQTPSDWQRLHLDSVHFAYPGQAGSPEGGAALKGVNLSLRRGVRYGLVGGSGCGKSTLLRLLAGLDDSDRGSIRADSRPWDAPERRAGTTLVPQRAEMIGASLRDNLEMGQAHGDDALWRALQVAGAKDLVVPLPARFDTLVTEAGSNWSGGQVQRLALARGVLSGFGSSLLLFDEPTSSLDAETERVVFGNLMRTFADACVVVSIHRLHLLDMVDEIVVMHEGTVADVGDHDTLMRRCGVFRAMVDAQNNWAEDPAGLEKKAA